MFFSNFKFLNTLNSLRSSSQKKKSRNLDKFPANSEKFLKLTSGKLKSNSRKKLVKICIPLRISRILSKKKLPSQHSEKERTEDEINSIMRASFLPLLYSAARNFNFYLFASLPSRILNTQIIITIVKQKKKRSKFSEIQRLQGKFRRNGKIVTRGSVNLIV